MDKGCDLVCVPVVNICNNNTQDAWRFLVWVNRGKAKKEEVDGREGKRRKEWEHTCEWLAFFGNSKSYSRFSSPLCLCHFRARWEARLKASLQRSKQLTTRGNWKLSPFAAQSRKVQDIVPVNTTLPDGCLSFVSSGAVGSWEAGRNK